jgi:hypothetical protein
VHDERHNEAADGKSKSRRQRKVEGKGGEEERRERKEEGVGCLV